MQTRPPHRTAPRRLAGVGRSLAAGLLAAFAVGAQAQTSAAWPTRGPVHLVIPFAAGGATDLLGRSLAAELQKSWKQTVVVENKGGAGGAIGAQQVAKAPADGYTLLLASASMFTVNPHIYANLPYRIQNFEPITKVASGPMVVTVNAEVPARNTRELIAYAKANPGELQFASAGVGSQVHIAGEAFTDAAGVDMMHVPYKGEGPAYSDLMAGVVRVAVGNINAISPLLKTNRLRALSVTGKERSPLLPDVPTTAEDGVPGFEYVGWFALMAPAGTPKDVLARVYADVQKAVEAPAMKRYFNDQGMTATISTPATFAADIEKESARWKALATKKAIKAN
jgi:tripartite-type tricarboxylate transporter receptor subunit TctC